MPPELVQKYAWTDEIEAWAVAVIATRAPLDVVRIYGGEADSLVGEYSFGQLLDLQGGDSSNLRFHLQAFEHDAHTITIENNGWSSSHPEIARRCTKDSGHFFSVYWNVNAFGLVTEARDGEITARFESLYPMAPDQALGEIRPAWAIGRETPPEEEWKTCLALLEQQTGVAFDPRWLGQQWPTYRIPDPHYFYRNVENADKLSRE